MPPQHTDYTKKMTRRAVYQKTQADEGSVVDDPFQQLSLSKQELNVHRGAKLNSDLVITPPSYTSCRHGSSSYDLDDKIPNVREQIISSLSASSISSTSRNSALDIDTTSLPPLGDEELLNHAIKFADDVPPPRYSAPALSQPIAIPQTVPGLGQPFARAYAPCLMPHSISESDFLQFIDNLNVVGSPTAPLQVIELAGAVVGLIPLPWFNVAGIGVQVAAKVGTAAISKARTGAYMKKLNKKLFEPGGLKASIVSRKAMAETLRLPDEAFKLLPVTAENVRASTMERRLQPIKPYIAELTFDIIPPAPQTKFLARLSARQTEKKTNRREEKTLKERAKEFDRKESDEAKDERHHEKQGRKYEKEMRKLNDEVGKAQREALKHSSKDATQAQRKLKKELGKIEKEREKVEAEMNEEIGRREDLRAKELKKDKEDKKARKVRWIVIESI